MVIFLLQTLAFLKLARMAMRNILRRDQIDATALQIAFELLD